jgi:lipopolysaccharide transport system ATP-binding protein
MSSLPTIFHLTHPKSGSQWIKKIFHDIAPERTRLDADAGLSYFFNEPIQPGKIYPTIYTSKPTFEIVLHLKQSWKDPNFVKDQAPLLKYPLSYLLNWFQFSALQKPYKKFFVIRDLRDTLISFYFSMKKTHLIMREEHSTYRSKLTHSDQENGLMYLMESVEFNDYSRIQLSWMNDPETLVIKFEDLIEDPDLFEKIIEHCEMNVSKERLQQAFQNNSFEKLAGHARGVEDQASHFRKGIAGDWRNYFSDPVKETFIKKFGQTLIKTNYEKNENW